MIQKQVTIKLFFNQSNSKYFVQLGEYLYAISETLAYVIRDKEDLEVRKCADLKHMQETSLEDDKNPSSL